jgi:CHAT domain-containing protein
MAILSAAHSGVNVIALDFDAQREKLTGGGLETYRIIHLATHGLLDTVNPDLSGLVFSLFDKDGKPQNGFLKLQDTYNLHLPAELVVLSACQTGLGKELKGEGLIGLTRGFMYAGAKRVVASLWNVNDFATAELMGQFYKAMLKDGMSPVAALRAAQLAIRAQNDWRDPYYWAAFTVQGDWK